MTAPLIQYWAKHQPSTWFLWPKGTNGDVSFGAIDAALRVEEIPGNIGSPRRRRRRSSVSRKTFSASLKWPCRFKFKARSSIEIEGVRFGAIVGVLLSVPMAYGLYALLPVPYSLALQWFLCGFIEAVLLGLVAAAVYRPKTTP
jgi:hypothetical protein